MLHHKLRLAQDHTLMAWAFTAGVSSPVAGVLQNTPVNPKLE